MITPPRRNVGGAFYREILTNLILYELELKNKLEFCKDLGNEKTARGLCYINCQTW